MFWKGLNAEIWKHMVLLGANPETDSIGIMINLAIVSEKALDQCQDISICVVIGPIVTL